MISSFLKKLLFARQFAMTDGNIVMLGQKQIMLPNDVIFEIERINPQIVYQTIKKVMRKDIELYAKKLGSGEEGMLKSVDNIFETSGLGKLEIFNIDYKKKKSIVRVHHPPVFDMGESSKIGSKIIPAVLSGTFSFLFRKDVDVSQVPYRGNDYYEYEIK